MKQTCIKTESFQLAQLGVQLYKYLRSEKKEFILSKQVVLRSATSVGANTREAHHAQSTADFIYKLSIAQKEANETLYWLELLFAEQFLDQVRFNSIYQQALSVYKIITSILVSTKQNYKKK